MTKPLLPFFYGKQAEQHLIPQTTKTIFAVLIKDFVNTDNTDPKQIQTTTNNKNKFTIFFLKKHKNLLL